jgi:hypothetical protein
VHIYWLNGGLYVEPVGAEEEKALLLLVRSVTAFGPPTQPFGRTVQTFDYDASVDVDRPASLPDQGGR